MLGWVAAAFAAEPMSLEGALSRALEVSEDLAVAEAASDKVGGQIAAARAGLLPAVAGSIGYQHQFSSQFDGLFGAPAGTTPTGTTPTGTTPTGTTRTGTTPTGTGGGGGGAFNPFAVSNTWTVGLTVQQGIYGGGRTAAAMKLAGVQRQLADLGERGARASVLLGAASAFYDVALADRLVEIASQTVAQAEATLRNAELAHEVGRGSEFDVLRARVELENQRVALLGTERVRTLARERLANLLDLEPADVAPAVDLEDPGRDAELVAGLAGALPAVPLVVVQAEAGLDAQRHSLEITRAAGLPSVGAQAGISWYGWSEDFLPPTDPGEWRDAASLTVSASIPLFNGGAVRGQLDTGKASIAEAATRVEQARELADALEVDAREALHTAEAAFEATTGTVSQADRAYEIAEVRFREGVSTQVELSDARLLRQQALANRASSARDLQVARIRVALLPLLSSGS